MSTPDRVHHLSTTTHTQLPPCRICAGEATAVGIVHGSFSDRDYQLARCTRCHYTFLADPWLEFEKIYDDRYYAGQGADPLVDYRFELEHPERSIRQYEWRGISTLVADLLGGPDPGRRWLDFGCGNGGLVRHLRSTNAAEAFGFDEGSITAAAGARGVPTLDGADLDRLGGSFDVVTAIEVIEHTLDPVAELRRMRRMLRPGGLLFLTTGNAEPFAKRLTHWKYVIPELHISYFEPSTLERALVDAGFRPERRPLGRGFDEVMKFKVLKNLHFRRRSVVTDMLPARIIGPAADRMVKLSAHPLGWAV